MRIAKGDALLPVQQGVGLSGVTDIPGDAAHGIQQAGFGIHFNMGFHAEIPLASFMAGVHL